MPEETPEKSAHKLLSKDSLYYVNLAETYDLDSCIRWINNNNFEKVCLQFPESLLNFSVDITAYIESNINKKAFILGDTAYGSCCVDEVAARHVGGDAIVHFGQACLSPVSIPVYYVLPKSHLDLSRLLSSLVLESTSTPLLILYDVAFYHCIEKLRKELSGLDKLKEEVCIPDLILPNQSLQSQTDGCGCSSWCSTSNGDNICTSTRLQRTFCQHPQRPFQTLLYIGDTSPNLLNFLSVFKDVKVLQYTEEAGLQELTLDAINKKISYKIERIRSAQSIGIVVATLGIKGYKEAIDHAKTLCKRAGKKSYILSLGKPNPAKLANFSQIDVYVSICCPEANFGDQKQYLQPICNLYELDLAINSSRPWTCAFSADFRDIINGGCDFVALDSEDVESLGPNSEITSSTHLVPVDSAQMATSVYRRRDWHGLDQRLGEDEAAQLTEGRSGGPQSSYSSEPKEIKF